MGELSEIKTYIEYRDTLRTELQKSAEGFVRIGYLLKQARDTDILRDSGYSNISDFALKEYGLTKDVVSRYIAINDKYSEGGNSDILLDKYKDFGYSKLTEMLTLPEAVAAEITPDITKQEIRSIKEAVREEESITDIEVAFEAAEDEEKEKPILEKVLHELFRNEPKLFVDIRNLEANHVYGTSIASGLYEILAPAGIMLYTVRIPGTGTLLMGIHEDDITLTNTRSGEKNKYSYDELDAAIWNVNGLGSDELQDLEADMGNDCSGHKRAWEILYNKSYPEGIAKSCAGATGRTCEGK